LQQPLALITALRRLTLAKAAVRRLRPVLTAFFWPCAVFARLCRFYTDASSIISPWRVLCRFWMYSTCTNICHAFHDSMELLGQRRHYLGARHVGRATAGEKTRRVRPAGSRKKYAYDRLGEVRESKTK